MKTNETIFAETFNLDEFWTAGGTWSMDGYIRYLVQWEQQNPEESEVLK